MDLQEVKNVETTYPVLSPATQEDQITLRKSETIKGGVKYEWDIKLIGKLDDMQLRRLMELNQKLFMDYGGGHI